MDGDGGGADAYGSDEIVDLLRFFGAGTAGSILLALRDRPLRTGELADAVPGFAPRTVYRHVAALVQLGAVERWERKAVPSHVVYSLTPAGTELLALIQVFARASLEIQPDGQVVPHAWRPAALLADLWESTMFDRLGVAPSTMTQLAHVSEGLSFHQVDRRVQQLLQEGFIREVDATGRRRHYELTESARRATALIVALGYWRERHLLVGGEPGLTADEVKEVMKAALSLVLLRRYGGKSLALSVTEMANGSWKDGEVVWAAVGPNGTIDCNADPQGDVDGWAAAGIDRWTDALLRGKGTGIRVGGHKQMIAAARRGMYRALWNPQGDNRTP